jgi:hypothetical protein
MGTGAHLVPPGGTYVKHGSKEYLLAATHPAGDSPPGKGTRLHTCHGSAHMNRASAPAAAIASATALMVFWVYQTGSYMSGTGPKPPTST